MTTRKFKSEEIIEAVRSVSVDASAETKDVLARALSNLFDISLKRAEILLRPDRTTPRLSYVMWQDVLLNMAENNVPGFEIVRQSDTHVIKVLDKNSGICHIYHAMPPMMPEQLERCIVVTKNARQRYSPPDDFEACLANLLYHAMNNLLFMPLKQIIVIESCEEDRKSLKHFITPGQKIKTPNSFSSEPFVIWTDNDTIVLNLANASYRASYAVKKNDDKDFFNQTLIGLHTLVHDLFHAVIQLGLSNPYLPEDFLKRNGPDDSPVRQMVLSHNDYLGQIRAAGIWATYLMHDVDQQLTNIAAAYSVKYGERIHE